MHYHPEKNDHGFARGFVQVLCGAPACRMDLNGRAYTTRWRARGRRLNLTGPSPRSSPSA
jgi:hypothetical protein